MDVEELRQRIANKSSATKKCRAAPIRHAQSENLHTWCKPRNKKIKTDRPPWLVAVQRRKEIEQMDDADRAKVYEARDRRAAVEIALRHPEPPQLIVKGEILCIDCEENISTARLQAKPEAARCISCQTDQDKKDKHRG
jgi:phage/conjugal plasmid C-4 type zinc finger TraR family protein